MATITSAKTDCWYFVSDSKKRKQIQNRLAQRTRRQRLAAKNTPSRPPPSSTTTMTRASAGLATADQIPTSRLRRPSPDRTLSNGAYALVIPPSNPSTSYPTEIPPSVFAALFRNGQLLHLTCGSVIPQRSLPASAEIPASLQPTELQLSTIHQTWIDRFPFPSFRDNFIRMSAVVEEEKFLEDLFSMESFSIRDGCESWDPRGWRMGRDFGEKWGWLFC